MEELEVDGLIMLHRSNLMRESDNLGDPGIDGRILLRCIFKKWDVGVWTGSRWLRIETVGGLL